MHEDIPILNFLVPKAFTHDGRQADRRRCSRRSRPSTTTRAAASLVADRRAGRASSHATTCWSRSARRTPFPGSSATSASSSTSGTCRWSTRVTLRLDQSRRSSSAATRPSGPKNIIWAVAHGHEAAISIDKLCQGEDVARPAAAGRHPGQPEDGHPRVELRQRHLQRPALPGAAARQGRGAAATCGWRSSSASTAALGFKRGRALPELRRRRRCSPTPLCIECDACVDICPMDCITFTDERRGGGPARRG